MKTLSTLAIILGILAAELAADVPAVYLQPDTQSPVIGELEALSLAVPAPWPSGLPRQDAWQAIFYQGSFEVYAENSAFSKDLSVRPGSAYYLSADQGAQSLAVATSKDQISILGVDTWFTRLQLETIVIGYIPVSNAEPLAEPDMAKPAENAGQTALSELEGLLEKTGLLGRKRTGLSYKLVGAQEQTLAFVDLSGISELQRTDDFLGQPVRISGFLQQDAGSSEVILIATKLASSPR